ncbi:MAG: hypothetical protein Q8K60_03350 [Parachlamydiaceae bacterium]|nr:hypothetical protein [Parachlamydiaceae bacterium]
MIKLLSSLFFFFISYGSLIHSEIPESTLLVMPPMNEIYHPVSTTNIEAQKSFNLGLTYIFAFNHDFAFREFEKASQLDPQLAMAYWGMALALGQNINNDILPENELRCYEYIQKAIQMSSSASLSEKDYIHALAKRYTNDPSIDRISLRYYYKDAMKKVSEKYPEDLDAAVMYAESILDLDPWKWWTQDGQPKNGVLEAIQILEFAMMRNPLHIGANHYYIHALEESPYPERALMSAHRLEYLLPEAGHLLHMPCHIFILVGDYVSAVKTSTRSIEQDNLYIKKYGIDSGSYPVHYLSHNLKILSRVYMLMEDYQNSIQTAFQAVDFVKPHLNKMPDFTAVLAVPLEIYLYFKKWNEILNYQVASNNSSINTFLHYCRSVAYANLGNLALAEQEKELMLKAKQGIKSTDLIASNPALKVIGLSEVLLEATFARANKNPQKEIEYLKKAVIVQNELFYDEPPAWYIPVEEVLGFALLRQQQYHEATFLFREALKTFRRNGRILFGLFHSLKGEGKTIDTYWIEREMTAALRHATVPLNVNDL